MPELKQLSLNEMWKRRIKHYHIRTKLVTIEGNFINLAAFNYNAFSAHFSKHLFVVLLFQQIWLILCNKMLLFLFPLPNTVRNKSIIMSKFLILSFHQISNTMYFDCIQNTCFEIPWIPKKWFFENWICICVRVCCINNISRYWRKSINRK